MTHIKRRGFLGGSGALAGIFATGAAPVKGAAPAPNEFMGMIDTGVVETPARYARKRLLRLKAIKTMVPKEWHSDLIDAHNPAFDLNIEGFKSASPVGKRWMMIQRAEREAVARYEQNLLKDLAVEELKEGLRKLGIDI